LSPAQNLRPLPSSIHPITGRPAAANRPPAHRAPTHRAPTPSPLAPRRPSATATAAMTGKGAPVKKVVLAYSGGLDTSVILKWLQEEYG